MNSYLSIINYTSKPLEKISKILVTETDKTSTPNDKILFNHVNNMTVKLGFMMYALDSIKHVNNKTLTINDVPSVYINYHLCNFIYCSKAFLDSVAVTLNYSFKLGFNGGSRDFNKSVFRETVTQKVSSNYDNYATWINDVINWRDSLIHKLSTLIVPYMELGRDPTIQDLKANALVKMPVEPIDVFPDLQTIKNLEKKYGYWIQEIEPFCEKWINSAKDMFNDTCEVIMTSMSK